MASTAARNTPMPVITEPAMMYSVIFVFVGPPAYSEATDASVGHLPPPFTAARLTSPRPSRLDATTFGKFPAGQIIGYISFVANRVPLLRTKTVGKRLVSESGTRRRAMCDALHS